MQTETFCPIDEKEWRQWLRKYHLSKKEIWLIYYKKHTGKETIPYENAVEEAVCFGWIDSIVKRIDEERYMQKFTPRSDKSTWSYLNKKRAQRMIKKGRMTKYGFEMINQAKLNGKWDVKPNAVQEIEISEDILMSIKAHHIAFENFSKLPPSHQKQYLIWVSSAKKQETKDNRINEIIRKMEDGEVLGMK